MSLYKCLECRDIYPHGAACDCDPSTVSPEPRLTLAMVGRLKARLRGHLSFLSNHDQIVVAQIVERWQDSENARKEPRR